MRFVDEALIRVESGTGGDGCASFRREKGVPFGGPIGGDGGRGGDVVLLATSRRSSLLELRGRAIWRANAGQNGRGSRRTGANGHSLEIQVPVGTRVFDVETNEVLADLTTDEQRAVIAPGGRGGLVNTHFKTSTNRAPRKATKGKPGVELQLRLELMVMADVGLLGFPNAGKSTFISRVSAARQKWPITLSPPLFPVWAVGMGHDGSFVVADIPGLIEGAADGAGLGHQFLKHLSNPNYLVSMGPDETEPVDVRYHALRRS